MKRNVFAFAGARPGLTLGALVLFVFGLSVAGAAANADDVLDQGLKVGETIPLDMSADDQNGDTRSLKSLVGRSGLILLFTRSLDW